MVRVMVSMARQHISGMIAGMLDDAGGIEAVIDHPGTDRFPAGTGPEVLVTDLESYLRHSKRAFPPDAKVLVIAPDDEADLPAIGGPLSGFIRMSANLIEMQTAVKAIAKGVVLKEESGEKELRTSKKILPQCSADNRMSA